MRRVVAWVRKPQDTNRGKKISWEVYGLLVSLGCTIKAEPLAVNRNAASVPIGFTSLRRDQGGEQSVSERNDGGSSHEGNWDGLMIPNVTRGAYCCQPPPSAL